VNVTLSTLPFGGFHMVFSGDFYQLPPVIPKAIYLQPNTSNNREVSGKELWNSLTSYSELTQQMRFATAKDLTFPEFLEGARVGNPDETLLAKINLACFCIDEYEAIKYSNTYAKWLAPTNKLVNAHNKRYFQRLQETGETSYRAISNHRISSTQVDNRLDENISEQLFKHYDTNLRKSEMKFAIGMPCRVNSNNGTQIGVYNGAPVTIHSFGISHRQAQITRILDPTDTASDTLKRILFPQGKAHILATKKTPTIIIFGQMANIGELDHIDEGKCPNLYNMCTYRHTTNTNYIFHNVNNRWRIVQEANLM